MLHKLKNVALFSLFGFLAWVAYYLWVNPKIVQYILIIIGVLFGLIFIGRFGGSSSSASSLPYDDWVERKHQADFRNHQ